MELSGARSTNDSLPPAPDSILHRSRLLQLLCSRRDRKLILIHGKAGQGKSCLAADFVRSLDLNALWYRCRGDDPEGRRLVSELNAALPGSDARDLYVVLEDFHRACGTPPAARLIQKLIEESPPKTHWVLLSRGFPELSVVRLRSQRQVLELDDRELAFTPDEIADLLEGSCPLAVESPMLRQLAEITDGWVTALVHLAEHLAPREPEARAGELERFVRERRLATLDEYFASEVLGELEQEDARFLVRLSVFSSLSPGLVAHVLGAPAPGLFSERLVERYFLKPLDESLGIRAFHPLFAAYLSGRFAALDPEQKHQVHARAAEYFRGQGHVEEAVHHLLAGGDHEAALKLFLPRAEELLGGNQLRELHELLDRFPEELRRSNSLLPYYEAITTNLVQPTLSRKTLREFLETFERRGDLLRVATIFSVLLVNYVFYQGNREPVRELVAMVEGFLGTEGTSLPEDRRATLFALVSLGRWWTEPSAGDPFEIALRAEETAFRLQNDELLILSHLVLGRVYLDRGEFEKARGILEETDGLLERNPGYSHYRALLRFHLGDAFFYLGELPKALAQAETGVADAPAGFAFSTYLHLNRVLYLLYRADIGEAEQILDQLRNAPLGENLYVRYYSVYLLQMLLAYRKGHRERTAYYCRRLLEPDNSGLLDSDFPYSTLSLAEILLSLGDHRRSESLLRSLVERAPAESYPYPHATSLALLGILAEREGRREEAKRCFVELGGLLERHGYRNLDICSPELLREAADGLRQAVSLSPPGASLGTHGISDAPGADEPPEALWAMRRLQSAATPISASKRGILQLSTLGEFRVFVGETELPATVLSRQKKVMDLLKLLVVHRKSGIVKEVLYDLFWPGYLQKSSRDNLNTIIYRLRKALGEEHDFVLTDGPTLSLNRELCRVDADEFLEAAEQAGKARQQGDGSAAVELYYRAKALYRGDFLEQDLYYDDIRDAREELRSHYLQLLFQMAVMSFEGGEHFQALVLAKELIYRDPLCEPAYRLLMIASALVGTRSEVPRILERLNQKLAKAYGIEADPQTVSLARSLLSGTQPDSELWSRETLI
ncbi:MAG: tetratricopeptide repeat protein [Spirochaetales bacterium]|nr:tetratricopeptide repeat protein [Spirochaetales bacterium]